MFLFNEWNASSGIHHDLFCQYYDLFFSAARLCAWIENWYYIIMEFHGCIYQNCRKVQSLQLVCICLSHPIQFAHTWSHWLTTFSKSERWGGRNQQVRLRFAHVWVQPNESHAVSDDQSPSGSRIEGHRGDEESHPDRKRMKKGACQLLHLSVHSQLTWCQLSGERKQRMLSGGFELKNPRNCMSFKFGFFLLSVMFDSQTSEIQWTGESQQQSSRRNLPLCYNRKASNPSKIVIQAIGGSRVSHCLHL